MPQASNVSDSVTNRGVPVTKVRLTSGHGSLWHIKVNSKRHVLFDDDMMLVDDRVATWVAIIGLVETIKVVLGGSKLSLVVKLLHLKCLHHESVAFHLPFVGSRCLWSGDIGLLKIVVAKCGKGLSGGGLRLGAIGVAC